MAVMMLPAVAPMLLLFQAVSMQRRPETAALFPTWIIAVGYLLGWGGGVVPPRSWQRGGRAPGYGRRRDVGTEVGRGVAVLVAGPHQLTPLNRVCLDNGRLPQG
jgi:predicted metal-binding membrane protein